MMKHTLRIDFEEQEGAMLRLLGLIQRRGFSVVRITMPESAGTLKTVHLIVMPMGSSYRIKILKSQIERLHEVQQVTLIAQGRSFGTLGFLRRTILALQKKKTCSSAVLVSKNRSYSA